MWRLTPKSDTQVILDAGEVCAQKASDPSKHAGPVQQDREF